MHTVLYATVSRGCPGEPDDAICTPPGDLQPLGPVETRVADSIAAVEGAAADSGPGVPAR